MPSRRTLLATAAGALLLESLAGRRVLRAAPRDPLAPWAEAATRTHAAGMHQDWRVRAAGWAVLAPNPHNRQPWLVELDADGGATLRCDLDRRLPVTDPQDRQVTIGLGCFAELFRMAAAEQGVALAVTPFPEGVPEGRLDTRPLARFTRVENPATPEKLFAHALARRSTKRPFAMDRPVPAEALQALALEAGPGLGATALPGQVARLRELAWRAWMIELETPAAHGESVALMRLGSDAVAAQPDGISVAGPGIDKLVADGTLTRESFLAPGRPGHDVMVARYRPMLEATPAYVWTTSAGHGHDHAFAAGQQWLRLNLACTGLGLALHPVSQALQEYPEMAGEYAALHAMLGVARPARLQMLARLGYVDGPAAGPTPRWPAQSRIRQG